MIESQGAQAGATAVDEDNINVEHTVNHAAQKAQKRSRREPAKGAWRKRSAKQRTTAEEATAHIYLTCTGKDVQRKSSDTSDREQPALKWLHQQWVPEQSTEELGDRITPDNFAKYNQLRPRMKCKHCPVVISYETSTDRKKHLLLRCPAFAKTDAFQDSKVQAEYKIMKDKATAQRGVCPQHSCQIHCCCHSDSLEAGNSSTS
jgi:hypothetical protein